jgi:hypothetical protein
MTGATGWVTMIWPRAGTTAPSGRSGSSCGVQALTASTTVSVAIVPRAVSTPVTLPLLVRTRSTFVQGKICAPCALAPAA